MLFILFTGPTNDLYSEVPCSGLESSKKQAHTFDTISQPIEQIQKWFPNAGAGVMQDQLRAAFGMRVPK